MRLIGISTGSLALGNFVQALEIVRGKAIHAIELSALREIELDPLTLALDNLNLTQFRYISFHAPSRIAQFSEQQIVSKLERIAQRGWPIVVHPDVIKEFSLWRRFGALLCVENNDKRKPIGRTCSELMQLLHQLPDASICLDLGHARQIDPTMSEAALIAHSLGDRIRQIHMSDVSTDSKHYRLSLGSILAFSKVSDLIPDSAPVILETPVTAAELTAEVKSAERSLPSQFARAEEFVAD